MSRIPLDDPAPSTPALSLSGAPAIARAEAESAAGAVRYHALDAARGILMMLGIVLHAANIYSSMAWWKISDPQRSVFFDLLAQLIHVFRMPAFYWISGFFCALTFERLGSSGLLRRRIPRLFVPLVATWLTLNVAQEYVLAVHDGVDPVAAVADGVGVDHLWFLVDLLLYMALAALALPLLSRLRVGSLGLLAGSLFWQLLLLALATVAVLDLARLTGVAYVDVFGTTSLYRLATYLPYFAAGILMYRLPELRHTFLSAKPWWLLVAAPMAAAGLAFGDDPRRLVHEGMMLLGVFATWVSVAAVLALFHRVFREESRLTRFLADGSYTIYLFHHPLVIALGIAFMGLPSAAWIKFTLVCVLTFACTAALHVGVVRRVRLLRYLFNGK